MDLAVVRAGGAGVAARFLHLSRSRRLEVTRWLYDFLMEHRNHEHMDDHGIPRLLRGAFLCGDLLLHWTIMVSESFSALLCRTKGLAIPVRTMDEIKEQKHKEGWRG